MNFVKFDKFFYNKHLLPIMLFIKLCLYRLKSPLYLLLRKVTHLKTEPA